MLFVKTYRIRYFIGVLSEPIDELLQFLAEASPKRVIRFYSNCLCSSISSTFSQNLFHIGFFLQNSFLLYVRKNIANPANNTPQKAPHMATWSIDVENSNSTVFPQLLRRTLILNRSDWFLWLTLLIWYWFPITFMWVKRWVVQVVRQSGQITQSTGCKVITTLPQMNGTRKQLKSWNSPYWSVVVFLAVAKFMFLYCFINKNSLPPDVMSWRSQRDTQSTVLDVLPSQRLSLNLGYQATGEAQRTPDRLACEEFMHDRFLQNVCNSPNQVRFPQGLRGNSCLSSLVLIWYPLIVKYLGSFKVFAKGSPQMKAMAISGTGQRWLGTISVSKEFTLGALLVMKQQRSQMTQLANKRMRIMDPILLILVETGNVWGIGMKEKMSREERIFQERERFCFLSGWISESVKNP